MADRQQSLMTGRPPVIQREYIDCKFPTPTAAPDDEDGSEERESACASSFGTDVCCVVNDCTRSPHSRDMGFPVCIELRG